MLFGTTDGILRHENSCLPMKFVDKAQSFIILAAALAGLGLGHVPLVASQAAGVILPLLMLMLTGVFLQVPLRNFASALQGRRVAMASVVVNFGWTPLFAGLLGWLFLSDQPAVLIGFVMLMVTPCTDWYLVFTAMSKGNVPLSTALLPINLVLQLLLLPVFLLVLSGAVFPLDWSLIVQSIGLVLVLPFLMATVLRYVVVRYGMESWLEDSALPVVQSGQTALLALAIVAVFASEGRAITEQPEVLVSLLLPITLFFGSNLALAYLVSRWLKSSYADFVSLTYLTLARNSPIALAIAVVAFAAEPLVALALVIGPLIELPVLGLVSQMLRWIQRTGRYPGEPGDLPAGGSGQP